MDTYNFGTALEGIKQGKKAKRIGWNGKDQYIAIGTNVSFKTKDGKEYNVDHQTMGNQCIIFFGSQGVQAGWLASQSDMLSDDWIFVEWFEEVNINEAYCC